MLPRVLPVRATAGGGDATPAHARAALIAAAETEIDGLREHRPGSPASRIHWPSVARGHGMMERKLISEADSRPLVLLDPRSPATPEALDDAVRAAASLCVHFARFSGCSLLLPGDRRAHVIEKDLLAWPAAHVRLALLDDTTGPSLVAAQNRRGLVVLVAARLIDRPPRGLGRTPGGCVLVVPGALPEPPRRVRGRRLPGLRDDPLRRRRRAAGGGRMTTAVAPRSVVSEPALSVPLARGIAFFALAAFGSLHWMVLLDPSAPGRALYALCIAALVMVALAGAARLQGPLRHVAGVAAAVVAFPLALLAAGIADEFLRPGRLGRPRGRHLARHRVAARRTRPVPRGRRVDPDRDRARRHRADGARRTGRVLAAPRRHRRAAARAVPARRAVRGPGRRARLRERVPARRRARAARARVPAAREAAARRRVDRRRGGRRRGRAGADARARARRRRAVVGLRDLGARRRLRALDRRSAGTTATARSTGRATAASCCASRPRGRPTGRPPTSTSSTASAGARPARRSSDPEPTDERAIREGAMEIEVSIRNLVEPLVRHGRLRRRWSTRRRSARPSAATGRGSPAGRCGAATRTAPTVYSPQTNGDQRERTESRRPRPGADAVPAPAAARRRRASARPARPTSASTCPRSATRSTTSSVRRETSAIEMPPAEAREVLETGPYGETWRLAQRFRGGGRNQEEIVQDVLDYLGRDVFTYTESPPPAAQTLEGFLFEARSGYCQQFSGAMTLLLRMAGVPARVVTGFTSGSQDSKTREYVVRDLDAHSWVEVWYDGVGWVTFDPTPASAPPRAQPDEAEDEPAGGGGLPGAPRPRRRPPVRPRPPRRGRRGGPAVGVDRAGRRRRAGAARRRRRTVRPAPAARAPPTGRARARRPRARAAPRALRPRPGHDAERARAALRPQSRRGRLRAGDQRHALPRASGRAEPRAAARPARRAGPRGRMARPPAGLVGAPAAT